MISDAVQRDTQDDVSRSTIPCWNGRAHARTRVSGCEIVRLEPLKPQHAAEMLVGLSAPEGYRFLPDDPPADLAELTSRYERQARGQSDDGTERWYNWIIRDTGSCAASGYTQATIRARSALIAYHVFPTCWRSGVGYQALPQTLDQLFSRHDADRAWALVDTRNVASLGLLAKLGFAIVARHDGADFFKGEPSHELELEIMSAAWRAAYRLPC